MRVRRFAVRISNLVARVEVERMSPTKGPHGGEWLREEVFRERAPMKMVKASSPVDNGVGLVT